MSFPDAPSVRPKGIASKSTISDNNVFSDLLKKISSLHMRGDAKEPQGLCTSVNQESAPFAESYGSDQSLIDDGKELQESMNSAEGSPDQSRDKKIPSFVSKAGDALAPQVENPTVQRKELGAIKKVKISSRGSSSADTPPMLGFDLGIYHKVNNYSLTAFLTQPEIKKKNKTEFQIGLNIFNKEPKEGITYLVKNGFIDHTPYSVAYLLLNCQGLSKQMIGQYMGESESHFIAQVLYYFLININMDTMPIDLALRKFFYKVSIPKEEEIIVWYIEMFSECYRLGNNEVVKALGRPEMISILGYSILMLNENLHSKEVKPNHRMTSNEFINSLKGAVNMDKELLARLYQRIEAFEFVNESDNMTEVKHLQSQIVGMSVTLALPHRRLVSYCRLYQIKDFAKRARVVDHQREVFLFNDLLVVTKMHQQQGKVTFVYRQRFPLCGLDVKTVTSHDYPFGLTICSRLSKKPVISFHARNDYDREQFVKDFLASINETAATANARIKMQLLGETLYPTVLSPSRASGRTSGLKKGVLPTVEESKWEPGIFSEEEYVIKGILAPSLKICSSIGESSTPKIAAGTSKSIILTPQKIEEQPTSHEEVSIKELKETSPSKILPSTIEHSLFGAFEESQNRRGIFSTRMLPQRKAFYSPGRATDKGASF